MAKKRTYHMTPSLVQIRASIETSFSNTSKEYHFLMYCEDASGHRTTNCLRPVASGQEQASCFLPIEAIDRIEKSGVLQNDSYLSVINNHSLDRNGKSIFDRIYKELSNCDYIDDGNLVTFFVIHNKGLFECWCKVEYVRRQRLAEYLAVKGTNKPEDEKTAKGKWEKACGVKVTGYANGCQTYQSDDIIATALFEDVDFADLVLGEKTLRLEDIKSTHISKLCKAFYGQYKKMIETLEEDIKNTDSNSDENRAFQQVQAILQVLSDKYFDGEKIANDHLFDYWAIMVVLAYAYPDEEQMEFYMGQICTFLGISDLTVSEKIAENSKKRMKTESTLIGGLLNPSNEPSRSKQNPNSEIQQLIDHEISVLLQKLFMCSFSENPEIVSEADKVYGTIVNNKWKLYAMSDISVVKDTIKQIYENYVSPLEKRSKQNDHESNDLTLN